MGCTSLTEVSLPDTLSNIRSSVFQDCTSLTSIHIPDSVTFLGNSAFQGCTSLESVTIGSGVPSLGSGTFRDCTSLRQVVLSEGLQWVDTRVFYNCKSLTCVVFPDTVNNLEGTAFYNCPALTTVVLPASLTSLGDSVFTRCDALWHVLYKGNQVQWNTILMGMNNDTLKSAMMHMECTGAEVTDPVAKACAICDCVHSWDEGAVTTPATCLAEGVITHTCTLCGITEQRVLERSGHTPGPEATAKEAQICMVCKEVLTPATGQSEKPASSPMVLILGAGALCLTGIGIGIYVAMKRKLKR